MRITIKDIAKKLNVHHSTVSRAIRMDPRLKEETGEMIRNYAKENGYHLNVNALKLRGSYRNTIAVIVPNINHRFFSNIINHLTDLAYEKNFVISIYQSNESYEHECSFIGKIIQQDVAGVIASVSDKTKSGEHFHELSKLKIPLVFFDRVLKDDNTSSVTTNNYGITSRLVSEIIKSGRTRIANVTGPDHINVFHERNAGYFSSIENSKLSYRSQIIITDEFTPEAGEMAAMKLFSGSTHPDAIISTSFFLTMGIVKYINQENIKIPEDVVIAGFGDKLFNTLLHPQIISVEQPERELAASAFKLLINQLDFNEDLSKYKHQNIELESTIIYNNT